MVRIENLYKIYKTRNKEKCTAVNDISLNLEDQGFVFIIGKSGSGKTTLLSLIGGLESITSGDIIVNGIAFSKFKYNDFIDYRNQMIGYIFQDFHLIDELTVEENIALSLDLQNIIYTNEIEEALKSVDLEGYGKRYPKELSGGEKQRVAVARALVKNPRIILADEPTGNLDSKTTTQILNLLKELSKERLVLIVSHNLTDARNYADRIIELSNGKIINDYIRNEEYCYDCKIENNNLILPINKKITEDEIQVINKELANGNIKTIEQTENVFIKNDRTYSESLIDYKLKSNKYNFKKLWNLTYTFIRKDFVKLSIYSFVVAALIIILGLAQLIVNFNPTEVIQNELDEMNQTVLSINKITPTVESIIAFDETRIIDITQNDIEKFKGDGYHIYELVNLVLDYGPNSSLSHYHKYGSINPKAPYYSGTRGTLITDESYVEKIFDGLEYICTASEIKDYGIYITDYSADAMILYKTGNFNDYESILGNHKSMAVSQYAYVNGIIKTGYKDKYGSIVEKLSDINTSQDDIQELMKSKEYLAFYDDVIQSYSISYTFNKNFKDDFVESLSRTWCPAGNSTLTYNGIPREIDYRTWFQLHSQEKKFQLKDNEIVLHYTRYNEIFGTNYNSTNLNQFVPHTATYKYYQYYDELRTNVVVEFDVNIVAISNVRNYASDDVMKKLLHATTFTSSLYFSSMPTDTNIFDQVFDEGFEPNSVVAQSLSTMTKAVNIFSEFFSIIFIGLCMCIFIILVNYGIKAIKERKYEIGILKALGIKDIHLLFIFGMQILLLILLVIILYYLGSVVFIGLSNDILVSSLLELAPNHFLMDIDVLYLRVPFMLRNTVLVVAIVLISFIIPLAELKALKPTNIIKAKE
ncbi:MAG: ABC transporter ATP-binding protein [Bacilli bacterium]|nr:ABC transporter ATP-binding protein [Bacilli bacterium]